MASNQKCPRPVSARRLLKLRFEPIPMREEAYAGLVTWFLVTAGKLVDCIVKSGYPHFLWITLCMNRSKQANYGPVTQVSFVCAKTKQNKNIYDTKAYRNALPLDICGPTFITKTTLRPKLCIKYNICVVTAFAVPIDRFGAVSYTH